MLLAAGCSRSWLAAGCHALPLLPFDIDTTLPLPGQTLRLSVDRSVEAALTTAERRHHSCFGRRLSPPTSSQTMGVVAVLEVQAAIDDDVLVTCVGRARAPSIAPVGSAITDATPVVPFADTRLEVYDILAAADYEADISAAVEQCRTLQETLQLPGVVIYEPLDDLIQRQRAALLPGRDVGGRVPHPGRLLSTYATRRASGEMGSDTLGLRSYAGEPPAASLSLALEPFWGADHDGAETQMRSFATAGASPLPPAQRLRVLQTRDTLERLRTSLVALTARQRRLSAQLALQQAAGGAGASYADSAAPPDSDASRGRCGTERGAWGVQAARDDLCGEG